MSGFFLFHVICSTLDFIVKSMSFKSIQAIGAIIVILSSFSITSSATCHTLFSFSLISSSRVS